ncbi:hypothetical protein L1049_008518 [Liquidambar formosana]|uniref:Uncharacterized protein n=1 Tax=Liquidambar formosana TaxID=63359 RepID=A0AAP0X978_LIQFO
MTEMSKRDFWPHALLLLAKHREKQGEETAMERESERAEKQGEKRAMERESEGRLHCALTFCRDVSSTSGNCDAAVSVHLRQLR